MGETADEVRAAIADLRAVGVDILTLGQYLQPVGLASAGREVVAPRRVRGSSATYAEGARLRARRGRPARPLQLPRQRRAAPRHNGLVADRFTSLSPELAEWWREQPLFFVATAPRGTDGHVNLSPKGYDTLRVLGAGSRRVPRPHGQRRRDDRAPAGERPHHADGVRVQREPAHLAHLRARRRAPGRHARRFDALAARVPRAPGPAVDHRRRGRVASRRRAATRCRSWISSPTAIGSHRSGRRRRATTGIVEYWATKNAESIDGLPGLAP